MMITRCLVDAYLRRRVDIAKTPLDRYQVRVARTYEEHDAAFQLVHVAYAFQGIEAVNGQPSGRRITNQHVLPESTVLVAYDGDMLVGTMTVTLDSPAGVPLDHDYPEQVAALREGGARLVEYGSLAVVRRCWHTGVPILLGMAAHWLACNVYRATHCVIGIHPKVVPLYRALYAFRPLGPARGHNELYAPVQGLVQSFDEALAHFRRHHRRPMQSGLLPHEHFSEYLPPCVKMPAHRRIDDLVRWKLPREVFRKLFIHRSDHLTTLDQRTREHLHSWRSLRTVSVAALQR